MRKIGRFLFVLDDEDERGEVFPCPHCGRAIEIETEVHLKGAD
jgi:hypothetical protein